MIDIGSVMQTIRAELNRQAQESKADGLYVYGDNDEGSTIGVDGMLDIQALAVEIVRNIELTEFAVPSRALLGYGTILKIGDRVINSVDRLPIGDMATLVLPLRLHSGPFDPGLELVVGGDEPILLGGKDIRGKYVIRESHYSDSSGEAQVTCTVEKIGDVS